VTLLVLSVINLQRKIGLLCAKKLYNVDMVRHRGCEGVTVRLLVHLCHLSMSHVPVAGASIGPAHPALAQLNAKSFDSGHSTK
jgi:hypothetical protein